MKYFNIDAVLNMDMQKRFTDFANDNQDDDWTVTIYCNGGMKIVEHYILSIINSRSDKVTVIAQEVYSAAFTLFMEASCKNVLTYGAKGMNHLGKSEMYIMSNGKPEYAEDRCILKNFKERQQEEYLKVAKYMNKKELKKFQKGDDVYFTFKRMKEIFPDAEVI